MIATNGSQNKVRRTREGDFPIENNSLTSAAGLFRRVCSASLLTVALLLVCACERSTSGPVPNLADYRDSTISDFHSLGWLGATSHPLNHPLSFPDPGNSTATVSPGGIVLTEVLPNLPIDKAMLKPGDVLVRVADVWLPIREDPTLDLIKAIEDQINAGKDRVEIGFHRNGSFRTTELEVDVQSLDEGLPLPVDRLTKMALGALNRLAQLQLDDGSFDVDSDEPNGKLAATSMAGLAFLAAEDAATGSLASSLESCLQFVGAQIDQRSESEGARMLEPYPASVVAIFLAESAVDLQDIRWLERFGFVLESLLSSQVESGAFVSSEESEVSNTCTTVMVLLALGALERKGLSTDDKVIENGLTWLREQTRLRIPGSFDRRIKSLLSAGTAAALTACNCDPNDVHLNELVTAGLERAHDVYTAPQMGLPGLFLTALAARQSGTDTWLRFHDAVKHLLVALQNPDGSFQAYPGVNRQPLEIENLVAGKAWETAHLALVLAMQSQNLQCLLAIKGPDAMVLRDSSGQESTGVASLTDLDAEARQREAAELTKMIMEQLREQGMEVDEADLKIESSGKPADK